MNAIVSIPKADVTVRDATLADVAFVDSLQKIHRDRVGFMATAWIEGKIKKGEIVVAEDSSGQPVGYGRWASQRHASRCCLRREARGRARLRRTISATTADL